MVAVREDNLPTILYSLVTVCIRLFGICQLFQLTNSVLCSFPSWIRQGPHHYDPFLYSLISKTYCIYIESYSRNNQLSHEHNHVFLAFKLLLLGLLK